MVSQRQQHAVATHFGDNEAVLARKIEFRKCFADGAATRNDHVCKRRRQIDLRRHRNLVPNLLDSTAEEIRIAIAMDLVANAQVVVIGNLTLVDPFAVAQQPQDRQSIPEARTQFPNR